MQGIGKEKTHHKNMFWAVSLAAVAILVTLLLLNILAGLWIHALDPTQSILWHAWSIYWLAALVVIMGVSVAYECYLFRAGGHSFAQKLKARRLSSLESTPEENVALRLNHQLAARFLVTVPSLYVLPEETGINALTAGLSSKNTVIILTWGAVHHLDEQELYGLLSASYNQMLIGDSIHHTQLKILYSAITGFSQWGSTLASKGFYLKHSQHLRPLGVYYVMVGSLVWLLGSVGVLIARIFKYVTLGGQAFKHDLNTQDLVKSTANIQTLLRIHVHAVGSQIFNESSEAMSHMCFANALSPHSWLNIHPKIQQRIFELNPALVQDLQLENLQKLRHQPLYSLFRSLEERDGEILESWTSPQPLPLLRLSPISFAIKDAIKPLNPEIRANMPRPELIQRAMHTATGCREVMVAILMIRQYREFIPIHAEVSRAIVDALLHLDGRVHICIFQQACQKIGKMPQTIARQFVTKLAKIIQEDGEIGLLDALLLERVKAELGLLPQQIPMALSALKPQIVRLVDALLHVQQINSHNQLEVREQILARVLDPEELSIYEEISDEPLDLAEILNDIAGLLLRDRLSILGIAEICLWHDRIITQDELDVLELLYWRLGFETQDIIEHMQKKNSLMII